MPGKYAAGTDVPSDRSRAEIERTLERYRADAFAYAWEGQRAVITFRIRGRVVRMSLPLPARDDPSFTTYRQGSSTFVRSESAQRERYEQAVRQRWRALALVIKAQLEAVELAIITIEHAFLADTVMPDGQTVGEWVEPQMRDVLASGQMPKRLPGPEGASR